jgi:hypothetical protein
MRGKFIQEGGFGRLDARKCDGRSSRAIGRSLPADDLFAPGRVRPVVCLSTTGRAASYAGISCRTGTADIQVIMNP